MIILKHLANETSGLIMRQATTIMIIFISLIVHGTAHSQITIFGISFGMSGEEIEIELTKNGFVSYDDDEFGVPKLCFDASGKKVNVNCTQRNSWTTDPWVVHCAEYLQQLRLCAEEKNAFDYEAHKKSCPQERAKVRQCAIDHRETNRRYIFLGLNSSIPADDFIEFECHTYNGCGKDPKEILNFVSSALKDQVELSADGQPKVFERPSFGDGSGAINFCMNGLFGDIICIDGDYRILLLRHKFGEKPLTLSLN